VIFLTAQESVEDEEKGLKIGAIDYIRKPFSRGIVQTRVGNLLKIQQLTKKLEHLASIDPLGDSVGVSGAAYSILMKVAEASTDEGMRVFEVASKLHVSGAFVTREANRLIKDGFLEKRPDPDDGRSVRLVLTKQAWQQVEKVAINVRSINGHLFDHLSREEFETLSQVMAKISRKAECLTSDGITTLTNNLAAEETAATA
jgi:DNA-binding MarR family transcriptional regulator